MPRDWRLTVPCLHHPRDVFFPEPDREGTVDWEPARAICSTCKHRRKCLDLALGYETPGVPRFGMWGGLTPDERDDGRRI